MMGSGIIPRNMAAVRRAKSAYANTCRSKRTLRDISDGLDQAFKARLGRLKEYVTEMDIG